MDRKDTEDEHKYIFHILITSPKYYINMFFLCLSIGIFLFLKNVFYRWSGISKTKRFSSSPYIITLFIDILVRIYHHLWFLIHKSIYKKTLYNIYQGNIRLGDRHPFPICSVLIWCIPFHILVTNGPSFCNISWSDLHRFRKSYRDTPWVCPHYINGLCQSKFSIRPLGVFL